MNPILEQARTWGETLLGFIYPNVCQICALQPAGASDGYVCPACWSKPGAIRFIVPPFCERCGLPYEGDITGEFQCSNCQEMELHFSSARAAVAAKGMVLEIIHRYKYRRALWFEPFLADLLIRQAAPILRNGAWDCIVPVPLHPLKEREREFNQAERLARRLGRATGIPVLTGLLRRKVPTRTQTLLSRKERVANVEKAFEMVESGPVRGKSFILFDDVLTTGATTSACAKLLRQNGAREVCVWTVARGL